LSRAPDVTGVDTTEAQLAKAGGLCETAGLDQVRFVEGHIEDLAKTAGSCDVAISDHVTKLSTGKAAVRARQPISIPPRRGFDERAELPQRPV
jgi:ubiquinone/menaquinone biosynthesis C-methylase UbiE